MDLVTARAHAVELMKTHGLIRKGWTFDFDRAKYRLGLCHSDRKQITISKYFTGAATEDEFKQAMLHEIAHALLPAGVRHGMEWKLKAREIGYKGRRLANNPYRRQRNQEESAKIAVTVERLQKQGVLAGRDEIPRPERIPATGDILALPNGRRIKVVQSDRHLTKAVEIEGGDREWILNSSVAYNLIQR